MRDIAHPTDIPHQWSSPGLILALESSTGLGISFPPSRLCSPEPAVAPTHPRPPSYPRSVAPLTKCGITEMVTKPMADLQGCCLLRWDSVFWGGWEASRSQGQAVPVGRSCPSLLIGNNNPCPWSTLKNNPASEELEVRPEAAACEHPGKEVGFWPQTSTGAGMVAGCCWAGSSPTPRSAYLLPEAPKENPRTSL